MIELEPIREYQEESIELLNEKFKEGKKCLLLVWGGGLGKTNAAAEMIYRAMNKNLPSIFIAHRRELIKQAHKRINNFRKIDAGIIMSTEKENRFKKAQIASIQTLQRREQPPAKLVIIDEAHRSVSKQYLKVVNYYKAQGCFIIGLTGTPFRTNKREGLDSLYEDFVSNMPFSRAIPLGYSLPAKVYGSGRISSKGMKLQAGDFRADALMKAFDTENTYINIISNYERYLKGKKVIVFCWSVPGSIKVCEEFLKHGYKAMHVDGETPSKERDNIVEEFTNGDLDLLINYGIAAEGLDAPRVDGVMLATATKSRSKYLQACWRGNRPDPNNTEKKFYIVIDLADNCERFGYPDEDIEVSLEAEDKTESSGVAPVKLCKSCSYMNHASACNCKDCGVEFKKEKKDIEEEEFIELQRENKKKRWLKYKQKDLYKVKTEELEEFAKVKKYSPLWVKFEKERRIKEMKLIKIKDFTGSKPEYYAQCKKLSDLYYGKKIIEGFAYEKEDKQYLIFRQVKKIDNGELIIDN